MKIVVMLMLYTALGIMGRKVFGYKGIVETVLWPLGIACVLYIKILEEDK